jgi:hypothetical protein
MAAGTHDIRLILEVQMPPTNVLYVVFHGLVCLVDGGIQDGVDQGFMAYLLDQKNDHKYMCGHFLAEQDLIPADGQFPMNLHLSDEVKPGEDELDGDKNPVVKLSGLPSTTSGVRAVIKLPRPQKISYYLNGKIANGTLMDPDGSLIQRPSQISSVRIFEYTFDDFTKVQLLDSAGNALWTCPDLVQVATNKLAAALHIYDEPPKQLDNPEGHNLKEFSDSGKFLGTANVKITVPAKVIREFLPKPDGILGWEISALDRRNELGAINHINSMRVDGAAGDPLGGGGGSQVCGGLDGIVTG